MSIIVPARDIRDANGAAPNSWITPNIMAALEKYGMRAPNLPKAWHHSRAISVCLFPRLQTRTKWSPLGIAFLKVDGNSGLLDRHR